ncbi:MAG TPA: alpha-L-arabinofuranosidase C-terminal domain-containing protein [Candidatus Hydrogenedentes bacterium]|nr:MAG: Intracellular exo-alpha-(1->5)-L-arabinofuranosidase [Candidatus Hydrogenedentes bacterium ADurb.Bin179]HOH28402.1 alpha-L-arabinofuranosidase C-terminal domain-containing protein [Candidatus Hydrogenedentota bacterium]
MPNLTPNSVLRYWVIQRHGSPSRKIYYDTLGSVSRMEYFLNQCIQDVHNFSPPGKRIPLAFDEWNLWDQSMRQLIQCNYNLRDGLWVASMLNLLHRVALDVPFANIAQMVNCIGIIWSEKDATFLTASGEVFRLYANHAGDKYLPAKVECPEMPHKTALSVLDVSATRSGNRTILFFVNRHYDGAMDVTCDLQGITGKQNVQAWEIHHDNPVQYNTPQSPHEVAIREKKEDLSLTEEAGGVVLKIAMKAHSILCVELELELDIVAEP